MLSGVYGLSAMTLFLMELGDIKLSTMEVICGGLHD